MTPRGADSVIYFFVTSRRNWLWWPRSKRAQKRVAIVIIGVLALGTIALEIKTSWIQSLFFRLANSQLTYHLAKGPSRSMHYPSAGPYDWTLGYARMPVILYRLEAGGYRIDAQARASALYSLISRGGLYPVYSQKDQAGLRIADRDGNLLYSFNRPQYVFHAYSDIPPLVVQSLLFIENRNMLDSEHPYRNPAVEWGRLTKAAFDYGLHIVNPHHAVIGGSTLATQLEKVRHSPGGRTHSAVEKFRQMTSATLGAYRNGPVTLQAQKEIVRSYINSIPLAAMPGYGDVTGLGDGLRVWYGADVSKISHLLSTPESKLTARQMVERALGYRQVLSLLLALRSPHNYLVEDRKSLDVQTDRYLRAICERGLISEQFRDLALSQRIETLREAPEQAPQNFVENKAANTIRMSLLPLLGLSSYDLDRMDLTAQTTIDRRVQQNVTQFLERIGDRKGAGAAGLQDYQLLEQSDPKNVVYSFTLYERGPGVNYLRVETDNLNQPLNINQDTRLELGSTAKLRTLINYLEIVSSLHQQYSKLSPAALNAVQIFPDDHLTDWAVKYLAVTRDRSLNAMLQAALDRKYSSSTGESFFTGGGVHHFENFEHGGDIPAFMTVRDAFHRSVNLVFIRVMRDIVYYYRYRAPGATPEVLDGENEAARRAYLARFADQEGRVFLARFYERYRGQSPDQALETLAKNNYLTATRAAVIFRSVRPEAGVEQFTAFLRAHLPKEAMAKVDSESLYEKYGPDKFNLSDRGYLAHVHPLELWLLNYMQHRPRAKRGEVYSQSAQLRQDVYWWLFRSQNKHGQDNRIRTLLEQDAFKEIYNVWKRQGYPFDSLVPSYATTIGVSGDTPAALAQLMGILVNNGMRYSSMKIDQLHFGEGTPTETIAGKAIPMGERVIAPEIAAAVRKELIGVVENGTARRAHGGIVLSDGNVVPLGGKTGTGDNRLESFSVGGHLIGSKVKSRTAAFVFDIGDRFFGTIIAYVPGPSAASYRFTSALCVQIFKDLEPQLRPLLERDEKNRPPQTMLASSQPQR